MKKRSEEEVYQKLETEEKYMLALRRLTKPERMRLRAWLAIHKFENLYDKKKSGNTALHVATSEGNLDMVEIIIKADRHTLYAQDKAGFTPLHEAVQQNQIEIVKHIIGVDIKTLLKQDKHGQTPLHIAIITANNKMVKLIISADRKTIYIKDKNGLTPLHLAATFDNTYIAELIASVDIETIKIADNDNKLPSDYAPENSKMGSLMKNFLKYYDKIKKEGPKEDYSYLNSVDLKGIEKFDFSKIYTKK